MGLGALESLLQASMGLSAATIGSAVIARAVQERLCACHLDDLDAYLECVRASVAELQALIEAVVVPETWFFRDRGAFTALARMAKEHWLPSHPGEALALLSLPCSTGEEPYSMAMALLDAGVAADRFRIDAVDISTRNLAQSLQGVYGRNAFRAEDLGFRDRYFDLTATGHRLRANVRQQVRFQPGNLFAADLLPGSGMYDAIFCRNLLIYFDRPTQDRALRVLKRLLRSDGLLFVAPAETALPADHNLISTNEPLVFAFRKADPRPPDPKRKTALRIELPFQRYPVAPTAPRFHAAPSPSSTPVPLPIAGRVPPRADDPAADLDQAMRLADQGALVEAAARCEEHVRRAGPSGRAFYLMGLVRDAAGDQAGALTYYRKALYLDPDHHETQVQLALLMEKQGDSAGARVLRKRTRRLEDKGRLPHE